MIVPPYTLLLQYTHRKEMKFSVATSNNINH